MTLRDEDNYTEAYNPGRRTTDRKSDMPVWRKTVAILIVTSIICVAGIFTLYRVLSSQQDAAGRAAVAAELAKDARQQLARDKRLLVTAQRDACDRSNVVRKELNRRVRAHSIDRAVLLQALALAARSGPLRKSFAHLRNIERRYVRFSSLPIRDCSAVIPPK